MKQPKYGQEFDAMLVPWIKALGLLMGALLILAVLGQLAGRDPFGKVALKKEEQCRAQKPDGEWRTSKQYFDQKYPCTSAEIDEALLQLSAATAAAAAM